MPTHQRPLTVYEPTDRRVPPMVPHLVQVWERRALVWHLARTAMKARHYDTNLGKAWVIVDPIVMAFTFYLVRVVMFPGGKGDRAFFIAHLIMGVSLFFFVRDIVEGSARSIISNRNMVLNTAAPTGVFPAVVLVRASFDLAPTLVVYAGVHVLAGQPVGPILVLFPLVLALLTAFSLGVGLLLAPFVVFYRDTGTLLTYAVRIWMYVTPVMYAVSEIPSSMQRFFIINPLYPYFSMTEAILRGERPSILTFAWGTAWAAIALVTGGAVFLRREREYAVRL